jgi:hypothetical protein
MIFSVEVEVEGSVFLTHPGTRRSAQKPKLLFHPPAANADRQMQTKLNAFPECERAFELLRGETGGFLAADHFRSCLLPLPRVPVRLVGGTGKSLQFFQV